MAAVKGTGQGLWKPMEMPIPKNFGPRIRPIENWCTKFDPKDPATWRSGAGRAATEASEANDAVQLKAVLAATPFVKFVLNFSEQLDAACRKKADRTVAVLLPWCDLDAWRQCLVISAQLQDCMTLHHLLCDVSEWPQHDAFRAELTDDKYLPAARPSLKAAAQTSASATPYREKVQYETTLDTAPCMVQGPWQRKRLFDVLPAAAGGRHLVLQRAAEAAARGRKTELLHAVMLLAMEPTKIVPFSAVSWQPRAQHWIHAVLVRARSAVGILLVRGEVALGKLRNFNADAALDYMSVVNDFGSNVDGSAKAEQDREAEMQSLLNDLAGKRNMLALLDHYLAVLNGGSTAHVHAPQPPMHSRDGRQRDFSANDNHPYDGGGSGGGSRSTSRFPAIDPKEMGGALSARSDHSRSMGSLGSGSRGDDDDDASLSTVARVALATQEVVRFDRRVPMRPRCRAAGDNPAWRSFVPQWTGEGGAHRVWKRKAAERAQLLHSFNQAVGASAEKPPELDAGAI